MSSSMKWFRVYSNFLNNAKICRLSFIEQRHFIGILALKSSGVLDQECPASVMDGLVARGLGVGKKKISSLKNRLMDVALIDEKWQPLGWISRQFRSDHDATSAERQKKFREKMKKNQQTEEKRQQNEEKLEEKSYPQSDIVQQDTYESNALCNGLGNAPDTDTDTDTELTTTSLSLSEFSEENSFRDIEVPTSSAEGDLLGDPKPAKAPKFTTKFCQQVIDAYHEILPELPRAQILTTERQRLIRKHFEHKLTADNKTGLGPNIENWRGYFSAVRGDDWSMGRVDLKNGSPPFRAKLEYLISERGFSRIHEAHEERITRQPVARHDWRKENAVISPCVPPYGNAIPQTQVCAGQTH